MWGRGLFLGCVRFGVDRYKRRNCEYLGARADEASPKVPPVATPPSTAVTLDRNSLTWRELYVHL